MTTYINIHGMDGQVETVDEADTRKEAGEMIREYRFNEHAIDYYLSQRCTNDWRDSYA